MYQYGKMTMRLLPFGKRRPMVVSGWVSLQNKVLLLRDKKNHFSNRDGSENDCVLEQNNACFRAVQTSNNNKTTGKSTRKNQPTVAANHRRHRKKNNRRGIQNSKKVTFDDFFSDLGKTRKSKIYDNKVGEVTKVPDTGMVSFFDEVDQLMKQKQKQKQNEGEEILKNRTAPALAPLSSEYNNINCSISSIHPPSITDIISLPSSSIDNNTDHCYHNCSAGSWDQYLKLMKDIMEGPNFLKKFKKKKIKSKKQESKQQPSSYDDETILEIKELVNWLCSPKPVIQTSLPTLRLALRGEFEEKDQNGKRDDNLESSNFKNKTMTMSSIHEIRSQWFRQELIAQSEHFMGETGWTNKQYETATGALVVLGSHCAKSCLAAPLEIAWSKLKEAGFQMKNKDVLHNYLYVALCINFSTAVSYSIT